MLHITFCKYTVINHAVFLGRSLQRKVCAIPLSVGQELRSPTDAELSWSFGLAVDVKGC
jgi:hypothetical protein